MKGLMADEKHIKTKPCTQCGVIQLPIGILVCAPCAKDNHRRFRESHPWLFKRSTEVAVELGLREVES